VAVRDGRQQKLSPKSFERCWHVGPRIQPMPREYQFVPDGFGKVGQTEPRHETLEVVPVKHVELAEGDATGPHLFHSRLVFGPPGVGKAGPVEGMSKGPEDPVSLPGDPGAPVHQGTENVKEHRPNGGHGRRSNPVFRAGLAPVWPRKIMAKSLIKWRGRGDSTPRPLP